MEDELALHKYCLWFSPKLEATIYKSVTCNITYRQHASDDTELRTIHTHMISDIFNHRTIHTHMISDIFINQ